MSGKGDNPRPFSVTPEQFAANWPTDWNARERERGCGCHACRPITMLDMRMILCPTCGNKRCPKANHHDNACTGSNEPGQTGSAYA